MEIFVCDWMNPCEACRHERETATYKLTGFIVMACLAQEAIDQMETEVWEEHDGQKITWAIDQETNTRYCIGVEDLEIQEEGE